MHKSISDLMEASRLTETGSPVDPIIAVLNDLHLKELDLDGHKQLFNMVSGCAELDRVISPYLGFISNLISDCSTLSPECILIICIYPNNLLQ